MDEFNATAADSAVLVIDVRQVIEDLQIDEAGYLELVGVFLDELGHLLDRGRLHLALDAGDIEPVVARTRQGQGLAGGRVDLQLADRNAARAAPGAHHAESSRV